MYIHTYAVEEEAGRSLVMLQHQMLLGGHTRVDAIGTLTAGHTRSICQEVVARCE